ncbi:membrane protein insertase YidC [Saccharopolyspora sp. NPDC003752]
MLDFIYYPVSAILWFWHKVFGFVLDPASGYAWALAVIFLVFTLRALLFKPFVHQVRSMKKMQEFAPQIRELQAKYGDDRQKLAAEMQKLQAEQGFNPISGCLPVLVQVPVFIGLFHVLSGFKPGAPSNFIFNADDVASFVAADLFGAKLSNTISQAPEVLATFGTDRWDMMLVGVPLMIAAAIATHFTARHSVQRQTADAAANPQTAIMNRMTLWIFPMFAIIGGPFLPLAILIYWLANNFWTLGQQRVVYSRIDREEAALAGAPAVVESTAVETDTTRSADPVAKDEPGEIPGVIEDRSRDADKPGESR